MHFLPDVSHISAVLRHPTLQNTCKVANDAGIDINNNSGSPSVAYALVIEGACSNVYRLWSLHTLRTGVQIHSVVMERGGATQRITLSAARRHRHAVSHTYVSSASGHIDRPAKSPLQSPPFKKRRTLPAKGFAAAATHAPRKRSGDSWETGVHTLGARENDAQTRGAAVEMLSVTQ